MLLFLCNISRIYIILFCGLAVTTELYLVVNLLLCKKLPHHLNNNHIHARYILHGENVVIADTRSGCLLNFVVL